MPVFSVSNHHRVIGTHHQYLDKQKNKAAINKTSVSGNDVFLREGKIIHQLARAGNINESDAMKYNDTRKQIQAQSLLNIMMLILSLKPHTHPSSEPLSSASTSALTPFADNHNNSGNVFLNESIAINSLIDLPAQRQRNKRAAGCTCEVPKEVPKEVKARRQAKAQRANEKRVRAKAKADARAAMRAAIRAEAADSAAHLLGSAGSAMGGVVGSATGGAPLSMPVQLLGAAGTLGVLAGVGIGINAVSGDGTARTKEEATGEPMDIEDGQVEEPRTQAVKSDATKSNGKINSIADNKLSGNIEINRMDAFDNINHRQIVDSNDNIQEIDISHIPHLTQFIHPMNYYRWLFNHDKIDQAAVIHQQIISHYQTDDIYIHHYGDLEDAIPPRFFYLRNSIRELKSEIDKAQDLVNQALYNFQRTTIRNDDNILQYSPQNRIKKYLNGALGTNDKNIIHEAMKRLEHYLLELKFFFDNYKNNVIFATSKQVGVDYIHNSNCPNGFVMPLDSGNRIVIMADIFGENMVLNNRLHITAIHEASHIQVGSRDFVYSPITRSVGDASEILEVFNEALYTNGNEAIVCDELFLQCYVNFLDINVSNAQFLQLIKNDPMLQKNVMMDNADSIAQYISDIAQSRAYDHDYRRQRRSESHSSQINSRLLEHTILELLIKHGGVA
ncbi:hypothetical protein ACL2XP_24405 [Sodalis sp. RH21]|uniref:hypothetical protein n=1 Tax=unclassified Sodalis (in: enterobacteria) TaxID=2636512 RepID=UPI0039B6BC83